jgi:hypothetical protein
MMKPILLLTVLSVPILICVGIISLRATQRVLQPASSDPSPHRLRGLVAQGILVFLLMLLLNYVFLVIGYVAS